MGKSQRLENLVIMKYKMKKEFQMMKGKRRNGIKYCMLEKITWKIKQLNGVKHLSLYKCINMAFYMEFIYKYKQASYFRCAYDTDATMDWLAYLF